MNAAGRFSYIVDTRPERIVVVVVVVIVGIYVWLILLLSYTCVIGHNIVILMPRYKITHKTHTLTFTQ